MNNTKIKWDDTRKSWTTGEIDLIKAINQLPDVQVKDFDYTAACDYLLTVESLQPILSRQVAAVAIAQALEIGYRTCKEVTE